MTGRTDQQPVSNYKLALKLTADIALFDGGVSLERAVLGDFHLPTIVQFRLQAAFDHQPVAGTDIARDGDALPNEHRARFCRLRASRDRRRASIGFCPNTVRAWCVGYPARHIGRCSCASRHLGEIEIVKLTGHYLSPFSNSDRRQSPGAPPSIPARSQLIMSA